MHFLLTNDDGIHAPGLVAMEDELARWGDVTVVAPATEQSGVSHSITFLEPLVCRSVKHASGRMVWAVHGKPADCIRLAMFELCERPPDVIVSGINSGLNAGINVLYSGTVAAAVEGAFFGVTSIAVSLETPHGDAAMQPNYEHAAQLAVRLIKRLLDQQPVGRGKLYNLNLPLEALRGAPRVRVVPMGRERYGEHYEKRVDPKGRTYYWATTNPPPQPTDHETDLIALDQGCVTVTPLDIDFTDYRAMDEMENWVW